MVTKKAAGKKTGKLKLKKETIKDLDVKGTTGNVKGGNRMITFSCVCPIGVPGAFPTTAVKPSFPICE